MKWRNGESGGRNECRKARQGAEEVMAAQKRKERERIMETG